MQNFAERIITDTRNYDHITPAIRQLNWLHVRYMLQLRDAVITFKCLTVLAPPYLCDRFTMRSQVHNCNTRNKNMLQISRCSSKAGQCSFYTERWSYGISCRTTLRVLRQYIILNWLLSVFLSNFRSNCKSVLYIYIYIYMF